MGKKYEFSLGQRVRFDHDFYRRRPAEGANGRTVWPDNRRGVTSLWTRRSLDNPYEGVVVGVRTVQDIKTVIEYEGSAHTPVPMAYHTAYLVAYSMHRDPVHVLPEDLEALL